MYKDIKAFIKLHFPSIQGCILFGSYAKNPEDANDIDLLLCDERFSFSYKESFTHNGKLYNTIKVNTNEILAILAKQYQQRNFFSQVFKSGIILIDNKNILSQIKKFTDTTVENKEAIAQSINEICNKIYENLAPLENKHYQETEFFLMSSKLISLLGDYFLLSEGVYHVCTEKSKSRYLYEKFPIQEEQIKRLISVLKNSSPREFIELYKRIIETYNIPISSKNISYIVSDDFSQNFLTLFLEQLFNYSELKVIIEFFKIKYPSLLFSIYQVDEENQEKLGCYITFDNSKQFILNNRENFIQELKKNFRNYNFLFPYNNIYCYPNIKFLGENNALSVNHFQQAIIEEIKNNLDYSREQFIFNFVIQLINEKLIQIDTLENFYSIKLDVKAKNSNFLINNVESYKEKLITSNKHLKENLILRFSIEKIIIKNIKNLKQMPQIVLLQLIDRVLSIFLEKDFQKLFYISCIKYKLNEKVS
jgi:hypothetical protein